MPDITDIEMNRSGVLKVIAAKQKDLGEFTVRRTLPDMRRRMVGPWIFFDHMGPAVFKPTEGVNVRPHPHIGLATMTYLFEGAIQHRDSIGSKCVTRPGDLNLMVSGKGIVHSEREVPETIQTSRRLHGIQLWHALPDAFEEIEPAFYHYDATELPATTVDDVAVRVLMGKAYDAISPVKTYTETLLVEIRLPAGQSIPLPNSETELAAYVAVGTVSVGSTTGSIKLVEGTLAIYDPETAITATALSEAVVIVIGGSPVGERYIDWNFVSSRQERIDQARDDWRNKRFPLVVGDEMEFIPLPD